MASRSEGTRPPAMGLSIRVLQTIPPAAVEILRRFHLLKMTARSKRRDEGIAPYARLPFGHSAILYKNRGYSLFDLHNLWWKRLLILAEKRTILTP